MANKVEEKAQIRTEILSNVFKKGFTKKLLKKTTNYI